MNEQKRIITVQDISCIGKCSATVALPILSVMGSECALLPTAVLSTHTGGFTGYTLLDMTEEIDRIVAHWRKEGFVFDGLYSGYLASVKQVSQVIGIIKAFEHDGFISIVDPVMADHGKLYAGFSENHIDAMAMLCSKADIVLPNITEASLMLGCEYYEEGYDEQYIEKMLQGLLSLGTKVAIITGVSYKKGELGIVGIDSRTGKHFSYFHKKLDSSFHGTGDIFASAFTGALFSGLSLEESIKIAADFTVSCIANTEGMPDDRLYGVRFEDCLEMLCK